MLRSMLQDARGYSLGLVDVASLRKWFSGQRYVKRKRDGNAKSRAYGLAWFAAARLHAAARCPYGSSSD